jgi:hypothetical protein
MKCSRILAAHENLEIDAERELGRESVVDDRIDDHRRDDDAFAVVCRDGCSGQRDYCEPPCAPSLDFQRSGT